MTQIHNQHDTQTNKLMDEAAEMAKEYEDNVVRPELTAKGVSDYQELAVRREALEFAMRMPATEDLTAREVTQRAEEFERYLSGQPNLSDGETGEEDVEQSSDYRNGWNDGLNRASRDVFEMQYVLPPVLMNKLLDRMRTHIER